MEALTLETVAWARKVGLSPDRVAFLLACPKYTVSKGHRKSDKVITDNPNHHLQRLGDCYWFRLRRRGKDIVENIASDLETARKNRDEMLAAYDKGEPIPHLDQ
jgi:hypothetical protein